MAAIAEVASANEHVEAHNGLKREPHYEILKTEGRFNLKFEELRS